MTEGEGISLLKIAREHAGLTLTQLSKVTNIPIDRLSKIENKHRLIQLDEVKILARALGCSVEALLPENQEDLMHA